MIKLLSSVIYLYVIPTRNRKFDIEIFFITFNHTIEPIFCNSIGVVIAVNCLFKCGEKIF